MSSDQAPAPPGVPAAPKKVRENEPLIGLTRPELAELRHTDLLPPYRTPLPPPLSSWIQATRPRTNYHTGEAPRSTCSTFARHYTPHLCPAWIHEDKPRAHTNPSLVAQPLRRRRCHRRPALYPQARARRGRRPAQKVRRARLAGVPQGQALAQEGGAARCCATRLRLEGSVDGAERAPGGHAAAAEQVEYAGEEGGAQDHPADLDAHGGGAAVAQVGRGRRLRRVHHHRAEPRARLAQDGEEGAEGGEEGARGRQPFRGGAPKHQWHFVRDAEGFVVSPTDAEVGGGTGTGARKQTSVKYANEARF